MLVGTAAAMAQEAVAPAAPVGPAASAAVEWTVASVNVRNYLATGRRLGGRYRADWPKPEEEKAALRGWLHTLRPSIVLLQEMGPEPYLRELQRDLEREGLALPHRLLVEGPDPDRHLALLAAAPWVEATLHTRVPITVLGQPAYLRRGMLEVVWAGPAGERWRLFTVHLKSRLTTDLADPQARQWRAAEIAAVSGLLAERRRAFPNEGIVLVGDFNATPDDPALADFGGCAGLVRWAISDAQGRPFTYQGGRSGRGEVVDQVWLSEAAWLVGERSFLWPDGAPAPASDHRLVWLTVAPPR